LAEALQQVFQFGLQFERIGKGVGDSLLEQFAKFLASRWT
jgi:hypothetical protein